MSAYPDLPGEERRRRYDGADVTALVLAVIVIAGTLMAPVLDAAHVLPEGEVCLSRRLAGIECPGCGLTRSFIALGGGNLAHALRLNWLAPSFFGLAFLHLGARAGKWLRPSIRLRALDLATLGAIVFMYLIRTIEIWNWG